MTMKKYAMLAAMVATMTACSQKQAGQPGGAVQTAIAGSAVGGGATNQLSASNATVFGRIVDTDWYMIATGAPGVKPLVIWVPSKANCESSAAEFNLKSMDPQRPGDPAKAWCAQGLELRTKYNIHGA